LLVGLYRAAATHFLHHLHHFPAIKAFIFTATKSPHHLRDFFRIATAEFGFGTLVLL
jgi:hypothetical protein